MPKKPSKPKAKPKPKPKTATKAQTKPKPIKQTHLKPKAQFKPKPQTQSPKETQMAQQPLQIVPEPPTLEEWDLRVEQARAAFDAAAKNLEDVQRNEQLDLAGTSAAERAEDAG